LPTPTSKPPADEREQCWRSRARQQRGNSSYSSICRRRRCCSSFRRSDDPTLAVSAVQRTSCTFRQDAARRRNTDLSSGGFATFVEVPDGATTLPETERRVHGRCRGGTCRGIQNVAISRRRNDSRRVVVQRGWDGEERSCHCARRASAVRSWQYGSTCP